MRGQPAADYARRRAGLLERRKYELLLAALLQHLFSAVVTPDLVIYTRFVWPLNMAVLGLLSVGVFAGRSHARRTLRNALNLVVVAFPLLPWFIVPSADLMILLSVSYAAFFVLVLREVMRHLLRPSYIDIDLVSAAICGVFLLLETSVFAMQALYYAVPGAFRGLDTTSFTTVYLDLVYFCSIVITSIGFGDITPGHHITKLATSIVGFTGQMYSVVLVGILVGKYTAAAGDGDQNRS